MFLFKVDFRKIGDRMHRELEKLRQELREAQQEVFDKAERIAKLAAEQSAGSAKVMRLQQQLDHFESVFRWRLDEEMAIWIKRLRILVPGLLSWWKVWNWTVLFLC